MTTKQEYALALEIALGGALQNIVVDREEDAKSAIGFLKQRDGGRATFLPLTAIRGAELREDVSGEYGFVGVASRLVQHEAQYDNVSGICWAAPWWWRIWTAASPWRGSTAMPSAS